MDKWNPQQYEKFKQERSQPFFDLLSLVEPAPKMRAFDLGCGTGELTRVLHDRLECQATLGIDSSKSMLERTATQSTDTLRFALSDLRQIPGDDKVDLIFSNAALHWVPDHGELLAKLAQRLRSGGQIAVQVPANYDHPSHQVAAEISQEPPFKAALNGYVRGNSVLKPEEYSLLLHTLGFKKQHVRLQVYLHELPSSSDVTEWVKGTLLTDYEKRLRPEEFAHFLQVYRERLLSNLGVHKPYPYAFKRILFWARKA